MHRAAAQAGGRIDAVFYCPHAAEAGCECRKPRAGLYEEIARRFNATLKDVPCIGDSQKDLEAAVAAGAQPVLVLTGNGEKTRRAGKMPPGTIVHKNLAEAVKSLVK
jgi:D-glycero-D-manno-heptose 1,7-bisphosphate phosphatase